MREIPDFSKFWADAYGDVFYGKGLLSFCMRKSHKLLEKRFSKADHFDNVIEIGSGIGYHIDYVNHKYSTYTMADSNEFVIQTLKSKFENTPKILVREECGEKLNFADNTFDRLIAHHVLEHIHYPEITLREWSRVVKPDGIISIALPCDPGIAWRLGRNIASSKRAKDNGVNEWHLFTALEHVNPIDKLIVMLRFFFGREKEYFWPFVLKTIDLNLFYVIHIRNKK